MGCSCSWPAEPIKGCKRVLHRTVSQKTLTSHHWTTCKTDDHLLSITRTASHGNSVLSFRSKQCLVLRAVFKVLETKHSRSLFPNYTASSTVHGAHHHPLTTGDCTVQSSIAYLPSYPHRQSCTIVLTPKTTLRYNVKVRSASLLLY